MTETESDAAEADAEHSLLRRPAETDPLISRAESLTFSKWGGHAAAVGHDC